MSQGENRRESVPLRHTAFVSAASVPLPVWIYKLFFGKTRWCPLDDVTPSPSIRRWSWHLRARAGQTHPVLCIRSAAAAQGICFWHLVLHLTIFKVHFYWQKHYKTLYAFFLFVGYFIGKIVHCNFVKQKYSKTNFIAILHYYTDKTIRAISL